ncbi:hypothetical protein ES703_86899 [subsurface metagenome]
MSKVLKREAKVRKLGNELIELLGDDEDEVLINALGFIQLFSSDAMQRARDIIRKK